MLPNNILSHRHIRYALFFHSLALIACIRRGVSMDFRARYLKQVKANQTFLKKYASFLALECVTEFVYGTGGSLRARSMQAHGLHLWYVLFHPNHPQLLREVQDAEESSLLGNSNAFRLYDLAVRYVSENCRVQGNLTFPRLAMENDWLLEEGWGLFLVCSLRFPEAKTAHVQ